MSTLKILTLNCWGVPIPVLCPRRQERMEAIGEEVAKRNYDIILLEEVWLTSDYKILCQKICPALPNVHYFYSGVTGSGFCIFSKFPIGETFFHHYSLNGHAHKIHHGDWFGGKGVGLCKMTVNDIRINIYISHIHAEYHRDQDEYLTHRVSQAFQMSQFIKFTSETCDVVLVGGDLNLEPVDLGYRVILTNGNLADCWVHKKKTKGHELGNTCELPSNSFTGAASRNLCPEGKRIDYLLYRANPGFKMTIEDCSVTMGQIPDRSYNYSDHDAVEAVITMEKAPVSPELTNDDGADRDKHLLDAIAVLDQGVDQARSSASFFQIQAVILLFLLYLLGLYDSSIQPCIGFVLTLVKLALALMLAFCIWTGIIIKKSEEHSFIGIRSDIVNLLENSKRKE